MEKSWKFFNTQFSAVFLHSFLFMDSFLYRAICLGVVKKRTFSRCTRTFKDLYIYIYIYFGLFSKSLDTKIMTGNLKIDSCIHSQYV
jgi:hypothetical protein